jgi:hypothetical protein
MRTPRDRKLFPKGWHEEQQLKCLEAYADCTFREFERLGNELAVPHIAIQNEDNELDKAIAIFDKFIGSIPDKEVRILS